MKFISSIESDWIEWNAKLFALVEQMSHRHGNGLLHSQTITKTTNAARDKKAHKRYEKWELIFANVIVFIVFEIMNIVRDWWPSINQKMYSYIFCSINKTIRNDQNREKLFAFFLFILMIFVLASNMFDFIKLQNVWLE